ncbi:hypothetical protein JI58_02240 [Marinosulfonomonas sp. PRT-SC04]|nr:hypothetical protein JI58_02240 [Marinosulfonomonas sp. PRT-SC04]
MSEIESYYTAGPVNSDGRYKTRRSGFDGFLGTVDGIASVFTSVGHVVGAATDIRDDVAASNAVWDDARLDTDEREQNMLLRFLKVERGDNVQLYYAGAAVALAFLFLR